MTKAAIRLTADHPVLQHEFVKKALLPPPLTRLPKLKPSIIVSTPVPLLEQKCSTHYQGLRRSLEPGETTVSASNSVSMPKVDKVHNEGTPAAFRGIIPKDLQPLHLTAIAGRVIAVPIEHLQRLFDFAHGGKIPLTRLPD